MSVSLDYYFTSISPFTYLGHKAFIETASKHGATINYRPVDLMGLWEVSGAVPPDQRPAVRQRYRAVELQRIAERRSLRINIKPEHFPVDPSLADHCVIAIVVSNGNPDLFMRGIFAAVWVDDKNISDTAVVSRCLQAAGHNVESVIDMAMTDESATVREQNARDAIGVDAVGVPTYVLNGEAFWGQDRIEYLESALASGRGAYTA